MKNQSNPHHGSDFDSFLEEDGILEEVEAVAVKRMIALKFMDLMLEAKHTKASMAQTMGTSRAAVDRLLNPRNTSVTLATLNRAAKAVGGRVKIEIVSGRSKSSAKAENPRLAPPKRR